MDRFSVWKVPFYVCLSWIVMEHSFHIPTNHGKMTARGRVCIARNLNWIVNLCITFFDRNSHQRLESNEPDTQSRIFVRRSSIYGDNEWEAVPSCSTSKSELCISASNCGNWLCRKSRDCQHERWTFDDLNCHLEIMNFTELQIAYVSFVISQMVTSRPSVCLACDFLSTLIFFHWPTWGEKTL